MMLNDRVFMKSLARLALPIAAQSLMLSAVSVADTLMLGGVEQNAMAAVSLASKFQFLHRMMQIFTNDSELNRIASEYLRIAAWSYLLTGFSQCYLGLLKISDHASETARISSVAVILNIALNGVLIFGAIGAPMGVRGAAMATLIARIVELLWSVALSFREKHIRPDYTRFFQRDAVLAKDFVRCMLPLLGAGLLWGVALLPTAPSWVILIRMPRRRIPWLLP